MLDARAPALRNAAGLPLRLVEPALRAGKLEQRYEARLFLRGELEVRERDWHDLLNVMVWCLFPLAKAALNERHYRELSARRARGNRGPVEDALTLFDEGGLIVAAADAELTGLLRDFAWKELFWRRRAEVRSSMRFLTFGHAIYEKALSPFPGITARAILLQVPAALLPAPAAALAAELDRLAAAVIAAPAAFSATRDLAPVPILGVPGWCADNEREEYYDDTAHFRRRPDAARNGSRNAAKE